MPPNVVIPETAAGTAESDLVCFNGIDPETGSYAFEPKAIGDLAKDVSVHPGVTSFEELYGDRTRSFGMPFAVDPNRLDESGWGIVFHNDTPQNIRDALEPLMALRRFQVSDRFRVLDYKKGERARDWYYRHGVAPGSIDPLIVPYYLLLVGPPDLISFEFQSLLGVEYAVGRLAFDTAGEYESYARSVVQHEFLSVVPTAKEIAYWGTHHPGDVVTARSASLLIDPLANGVIGAVGALKRPIHSVLGYDRKVFLGEGATKEALLATLHASKPPALVFTASHGMAFRPGQPGQALGQGALLSQDWPCFGGVRAEHVIAASDIADDANVSGVVAFLFASFGAGTPDTDQLPTDSSRTASSLAPQPFIAALPKRLLSHPNGGALAVIGHVDRAWGFATHAASRASPKMAQFHNTLGLILSGGPVGHALTQQFGGRFSALSTLLLSATSSIVPGVSRLSDRDLASSWLERNDAQSYALLGDPAVRLRVQ